MAEYADNFVRADNTDIGSQWDNGYTPAVNAEIVSNLVRSTLLGEASEESYNGFTPTADQFAGATVRTFTGAAIGDFGVLLRCADVPTRTHYVFEGDKNPTSTAIIKRIAGAATTLSSSGATGWVANDEMLGIVRGTSLFLFKNKTLILTATDNAIASGKVGFRCREDGTLGNVELNNFIGGDIRKTRFYLPNTGAPEISPVFTLQASWTATTGADRIKMLTIKKASTMTSKTQAAPGTTANQKWLYRQYVSDPLIGSGTIFGVLFGQIRGLESAINDNIDAISLKLLVVKQDATLNAALLALANYGTVAELNTALRNKIIANGDGLTPVNYNDGDRIVAEIGLTNTTTGTSVSGDLSFGDDSATDLAEDETATAANNPWLEIAGIVLPIGCMSGPNAQTVNAGMVGNINV